VKNATIRVSQTVGTTSAAKTVNLTNRSGAALTISSIFAGGDYTIVSVGSKPCGTTVAGGGKYTFGVTFTRMQPAPSPVRRL